MEKHLTWLFENLINIRELREILGNRFSERTIYRWMHQGLPVVRIRGRLFFQKHDVISWLKRSSLNGHL